MSAYRTKKLFSAASILCGAFFFGMTGFSITLYAQALTPEPSTQAHIETKSQEIGELERQIERYGEEIEERQTRQRSLKNDIAVLDVRIKKAELEIRRLSLLAAQLGKEISGLEGKITETEKEIVEKRDRISLQLKTLNQDERLSDLLLYVAGGQFSDFFEQLHALEVLQEKLHQTLLLLREQKEKLEQDHQEVSLRKTDTENLKDIQVATRESLAANVSRRRELLTATRGEEKKFQELIKTSRANVEQLKNEIYYLQRIGVTAEQAAALGVLVADRIGIRSAFLIAILEIESRLGANVGTGTWKVDMHPRDHEAFLQITAELGLNPDTTPVSKKPSYGWGGAMGPAQFLPTTWLGYKDRIASFTGRRPPNPWNIEDAFFAAAIKLARDGASSKTASGELAAAKTYIGGSPYCSRSICNYYANLAIDKAAAIERTLQ